MLTRLAAARVYTAPSSASDPDCPIRVVISRTNRPRGVSGRALAADRLAALGVGKLTAVMH
jgi:hypothetical protein